MQWLNNNLIDEKNKFLVGYNAGGDCCDWADIGVYNSEDIEINPHDFPDWEFIEFPMLDVQEGTDKIAIKNSKTGEVGYVLLTSYNNGYYSACYWTEQIE